MGTPLKDWDIQINYGIKTGCNEAFIITTEKRDEILANCHTEEERQRTAELIRPILRGRDIKRYSYEWANLWLIATFPSRHYDIEQYPAVKAHLESYYGGHGREVLAQTGATHIINGEKVKSRKKTSNKWFETQDSISYWEDFSQPKLFYADISQTLNFVRCNEYMFCNNTTYFMTASDSTVLEKLSNYLNSPLIDWYYRTLSVQLGEKAVRLFSIYVLNIPIPKSLGNDIISEYELTEDESNYIMNQ